MRKSTTIPRDEVENSRSIFCSKNSEYLANLLFKIQFIGNTIADLNKIIDELSTLTAKRQLNFQTRGKWSAQKVAPAGTAAPVVEFSLFLAAAGDKISIWTHLSKELKI